MGDSSFRISGSRRCGNGSGGVGWSRSTVRSSKGDCNRTAVRGGKATTESEALGQLELFPESADSPQGAVAGMDAGRPASAPRAVPVSGNSQRPTPCPPQKLDLSESWPRSADPLLGRCGFLNVELGQLKRGSSRPMPLTPASPAEKTHRCGGGNCCTGFSDIFSAGLQTKNPLPPCR
jgi:hypothetical protein